MHPPHPTTPHLAPSRSDSITRVMAFRVGTQCATILMRYSAMQFGQESMPYNPPPAAALQNCNTMQSKCHAMHKMLHLVAHSQLIWIDYPVANCSQVSVVRVDGACVSPI